jgi:hypothetical protein
MFPHSLPPASCLLPLAFCLLPLAHCLSPSFPVRIRICRIRRLAGCVNLIFTFSNFHIFKLTSISTSANWLISTLTSNFHINKKLSYSFKAYLRNKNSIFYTLHYPKKMVTLHITLINHYLPQLSLS